MNKSVDILLFGTGSLAQAFCFSFATMVKDKYSICVVGRDNRKAKAIAAIASCRSTVSCSNVTFGSEFIDWNNSEMIYERIESTRPRIVLLMSSLQSPWEEDKNPSQWTQILSAAKYGLSLPLQALFAYRLSKVINNFTKRPLFVNACYPDAVNYLLYKLNLPIDIGVGNIAILATILQNSFCDSRQSKNIKILAHHAHIRNFTGLNNLPLPVAWLNNNPIPDLLMRLSILNYIHGEQLNQITAATAVLTICALLGSLPILIHAPGPNGLPGGYPIVVSNKDISIQEVPEMSLADMISWNKRAAVFDGVQILEDGKIEFSNSGKKYLEKFSTALANGFYAEELEDFVPLLLNCREKYRRNEF